MATKYSEAANKATQRYQKKTYDRVSFRLRKDADLTYGELVEIAAAAGESVNEYILNAVKMRIESEKRDT